MPVLLCEFDSGEILRTVLGIFCCNNLASCEDNTGVYSSSTLVQLCCERGCSLLGRHQSQGKDEFLLCC